MRLAEIQKLLSGSNDKLDIKDLRSNAEYIGGFHSGHRVTSSNCNCALFSSDFKVIKWLWEIIEDFDSQEQQKFLKFVNSCSRAPILGFSTLEVHLSCPFSATGLFCSRGSRFEPCKKGNRTKATQLVARFSTCSLQVCRLTEMM